MLIHAAALIVALFPVEGCGGSSRADRILADEDLFPATLPEAVEYSRNECPAFARAAGVHTDQAGAAITVKTSLSAAVPAGHQPLIERVTSRHGTPDSTSEMTHYYDDVGLRTDSNGAVVEVVVPCAP